ncbi:MAG TPA: hypothetical protein VLG37_01770 [Candidatus Saccharimonadales bacterium]|nr:hypothetical protein [Candidatus Saccharimonadales bacterium]
MINRRGAFVPFVEHMKPAIVAGFEQVDLNSGTTPDAIRTSLEAAATAAINDLDWEGIEVPRIIEAETTEEPEFLPNPRGTAVELVKIAFTDAEYLINLARHAKKDLPELAEVPLSDLLRRSGRQLLQFAYLSDLKRQALIFFLNRGLNPDTHSPSFPLEVMSDPDGQPILQWRPEFKEWIRRYTEARRGCPASSVFVEHEGRRVSLLEFFWDRVVETLTEDQSRQA